MEVQQHTMDVLVSFRDVDATKHITMNAIVDYMQEIANQHAEILGIDFSTRVDAQKLYWIVSRAKVQVEKYPVLGDKITFITQTAGIDKLFAVRHFDIVDGSGEKIGYIIGDYVLMDQQTKRPIRLKNLEGTLKCLEKPYIGESLPKLKGPVSREQYDERKVRSSEIDLNAHMNNAHYVRWTIDMFSWKEMQSKQIESIQTNYITSLTEGVSAKIIRGLDDEGNVIIQGTSLDETIIYWTSKVVLRDLY